MKPVHEARGPVATRVQRLQTGVCCPLPGPARVLCRTGRLPSGPVPPLPPSSTPTAE